MLISLSLVSQLRGRAYGYNFSFCTEAAAQEDFCCDCCCWRLCDGEAMKQIVEKSCNR